MSSLVEEIHSPAIDNLIAASNYELNWVPQSEITYMKSSPMNAIHYAVRKHYRYVRFYKPRIILLFLGSCKECTPTLVSKFARIYSLPTHKYNNDDNNFRRYKRWLEYRNDLIQGFTNYKANYYMVAHIDFYHYYS